MDVAEKVIDKLVGNITKEEAAEVLRNCGILNNNNELKEAFKGILSKGSSNKTFEEALKDIDNIIDKIETFNDPYPNISEDTVYKVREAVIKQIPLKLDAHDLTNFQCNSCGCEINFLLGWKYCPRCGQAISK